MTFQLPAGLPPEQLRMLERSFAVGGRNRMPSRASVQTAGNSLILDHPQDESLIFQVPWPIEGFGHLLCGTTTLMARDRPYPLPLELARGKLHQLRAQGADWEAIGVPFSADLAARIRAATRRFGQAVIQNGQDTRHQLACSVLAEAYEGAHQLVLTYIRRVFEISHQRSRYLPRDLVCRVGLSAPDAERTRLIRDCFTRLAIPLSWAQVEPREAAYSWEATDALVDWAVAQELPLSAGPLIDFTPASLPAWLWGWERDPLSVSTFMCRFVEAALRRYRTRIRRWQLSAGSGCATVLRLSDDDLLGMTQRLLETARHIDPGLELIVGVSQPWGEYLVQRERRYSPIDFVDELVRSRLGLTAIDLEILVGTSPHGSYCRDLLETSRLLDLYSWLGIPMHVTLGYPASPATDPDADPEAQLGAGWWQGGYSPAAQAAWAEAFTTLALAKSAVQSVAWTHFADSDRHQLPAGGLLDAEGSPRPALDVLRALRRDHLPPEGHAGPTSH